MLKEGDASALLRAARSDAKAFADFYALFEQPLMSFFMRAAGRPELALDLAAETFARALEHLDSYDCERGTAEQWLFGIARNLLVDSYRLGQVERAARTRLGVPSLVLDDHASEVIARLTEGDRATIALARLPEEQQHAIRARVLEGHDYEEIAAGLRCSEAVVRQRVSRGLRTLRTRLAGAR